MSIHRANSPLPSLTEAKKQRKKLEKDAMTLSNRIKLLESEELKAWKKIEEIKKKQKEIHESRKKIEETAKQKLEIYQKNLQKREENNQKIINFKGKLESSKTKKLEIILEHKKKSHAEIREIREKSIREKYQVYNQTLDFNKKRSQSVKLSHRKQARRVKELERLREENNKAEYLKRVMKEQEIKKNYELKVAEMEEKEAQLIKKLQDTQMIQAKFINELEETIKSKPQTPCK